MNKNDKPWEETKRSKEALRLRIAEHMLLYNSCDERCWHWTAWAFVAAHDHEMSWAHQMSCGWVVGSEFDEQEQPHAGKE